MSNHKELAVATVTEAVVITDTAKIFTIADAEREVRRLFNALADATENPAIAVDIISKIADGIESDPDFSKQILTPENIAKAYALKAKADAGTIKLIDLEKAFPIIAEKIPFWHMVKTFV